jgi:outer membrane protein assembly factor BamB
MNRISLAFLVFATLPLCAEDWPEWRGQGRRGVWNETGILEKFPEQGLKVEWRAPIHAGYSGPSVSGGRVFISDFSPTESRHGIERALCLDEKTGKVLWTREWDADYTGITYEIGPRATPTVDGDRVYVLGARGLLFCLNTGTGEIVWKKDFVADYGMVPPHWGTSSAPLVDGKLVICLAGAGAKGATVVAFDKTTGAEIWRAIQSESEPGYGQPIIVEAGGARQLIVWHPTAVFSLDPATGAIHWQEPFQIRVGLTVATPVVNGRNLLVSAFYNGSLMLELDATKPAARVLWRGHSNSEINTDGLHSLISTPLIRDGFVFGICSYGQFRCLNAATGERVWETPDVTREKARWAMGFIVQNGARTFINNDRGELIIADLKADAYHEISRNQLIKPTTPRGGRRELSAVNWVHPAYANGHIFTRNDEEIISVSLEAPK